MKIAIYERLRTADHSTDAALRELREYAARRGWEIAGEFVDDEVASWDSREELDRLIRQARMRSFDLVLVWKLDRWGRTITDCVRNLQQLAATGIRLQVLKVR